MLSGKYRGADIGSGTNGCPMSEDLRAGEDTIDEFHEADSCMHRSHGHCMTMGTASTCSMSRRLGSACPATRRSPRSMRALRARAHGGRRIVEMVKETSASKDPDPPGIRERHPRQRRDRRLDQCVIPLIAIARRIGVDLALEDFDRLGRGVHTLVNLMPNGKHLMEDSITPAGLPVVIRELGKRGCSTSRRSRERQVDLGEQQGRALREPGDVITSFEKPFKKNSGIAVLAATSARTARSSALGGDTKLMKHKGRARVRKHRGFPPNASTTRSSSSTKAA